MHGVMNLTHMTAAEAPRFFEYVEGFFVRLLCRCGMLTCRWLSVREVQRSTLVLLGLMRTRTSTKSLCRIWEVPPDVIATSDSRRRRRA